MFVYLRSGAVVAGGMGQDLHVCNLNELLQSIASTVALLRVENPTLAQIFPSAVRCEKEKGMIFVLYSSANGLHCLQVNVIRLTG